MNRPLRSPTFSALGRVLLAVLAAGCAAEGARQDVEVLPAGASEAARAIDEATLESLLQDLAADRMEGRGPGSAGDERARRYIADYLESVGVEPGAPGASWQQRFDIVGITARMPPTWAFRNAASELALTALDEFVAASGVQQDTASLEGAEVVFVGYGIQAPEYGWDDYGDADLEGKVLLMMNNDPDWDPELFEGDTRLYYGRWTYKYETAAARGAAGAIIIHTEPSAGYPWQVVRTSWTGEQFELPARGEPRVEVEAWVTEAAAERLVALGGFDLDELRQVARTREFRPVPLGLTTSIALENRLQETETANVLGLVRGRDPELRDEVVVYTAHHDHLGIGEPDDEGDAVYNGARDNASGVAMILAVAKAFEELPRPPRRSTLFALVGAEEQGLLGSEYYARNPTFPPGRIAANINIDGGNVFGRTTDVGFIGYGKSSLDGVIERIAALQGRTVTGDQFPDRGYFYRSDQFNFAKIGVPALYLEPGTDFVGRPEGWGREQVEHYTRHHYHQPSDEVDPSWSYDGMAEDARLAFWCGLVIAEDDAMPRWNPGDEFEAAREEALAALR